MLEAISERATGYAPADIAVDQYHSSAHVIIGPAGQEHLLLRDAERALTLRLRGSRATLGPVNTTFLLRGIPKPKHVASDFAILSALVHWPRHKIHRSRKRLFFRDALVALDGQRAGASYRETAEVIFGMKRVREDWSHRSGWLKERMRRALAKGQEFSDGGYQKSLQRVCRFSF